MLKIRLNFQTVHRITANHPKPPQTTPNHRKPHFIYYNYTDKAGGGYDNGTETTPNHILYIIIIKIGLGWVG